MLHCVTLHYITHMETHTHAHTHTPSTHMYSCTPSCVHTYIQTCRHNPHIALHCNAVRLHCIALEQMTLHCIKVEHVTIHCITLHLHVRLICDMPSPLHLHPHHMTPHHATIKYITLHYVALHYITSHLHYLTLH